MTSTTTQPAQKSLFQLLEERNNRNVEAKKLGILGSAMDMASDTLNLIGGSIKGLSKGVEIGNNYMDQELDSLVGTRTATKVEATLTQLTAIAQLTALGATAEEAILLATSYRL